MSQLILNTSGPAMDQRLAAAVGDAQALGRNATLAEVKQYIIGRLSELVQAYEFKQSQAAIVNTPVDIT